MSASSHRYMSCGGLLDVDGSRMSGESVRTQNVTASVAIANIVRSSLGPSGLDKMMVDEVGDVIVTNDGATVLSNLDIEHPAARVLVDLARLQDQECGDGTTGVVLMAAELLKKADDLVRQRIHPTSVILGYRMACKEACRYINTNLATARHVRPDASAGDASDASGLRDTLLAAARTSIGSKIIGGADAEHFAGLVVDAALAIKGKNNLCPIRSVNVLKAHGAGARDSCLIHGYAIPNTIAAASMPHRVAPARIACVDFTLQKSKARVGVEVRITQMDELTRVRMREFDMSKEKVQKIIAAGINVLLTTGGVDDLCLKYFSDAGIIVVRRVKVSDLKRIARATGASFLTSLSDMDGEEVFTENMYGVADEVYQECIADDEMIVIRGPRSRGAASIVVRGPNDTYCEEMERSIHDALCAIKRTIEGGAVVAGGGAVESALSVWLEDYANSIATREQLAITEFAAALLTIPTSLAVNGAYDATDLTAKLRAQHHLSQTQPDMAHLRWTGLDLDTGKIRDNMKAGVIEPATSKIKAIRFATEAAITILRIDDMIRVNPPPPGPDQRGKSYEEARACGQLEEY